MKKPTRMPSPKKVRPAQKQTRQPGLESQMEPLPVSEKAGYRGTDKLSGKVALITGGDSGIGRAVAILFAHEGADVVICHVASEKSDATRTAERVRQLGRRALTLDGDLARPSTAQRFVRAAMREFGRLDIVVNNAAVQFPAERFEDITPQHLEQTFRVNILAQFYLTQAALPHLKKGSSIVNTASVVAYEGNPQLVDYSATKGAIVTFTRSLALALAPRGIRVNAVAPGPIWTPLIPATFPPGKVAKFGTDTPLERAGQPAEVATCYVFLASEDGSYLTGQVLHPNGGRIVNA